MARNIEMSQHNVERVLGQLVTDEGFRHRFVMDPHATIYFVMEGGCELNECEREGLLSLDLRMLVRFANSIHPCLQKTDLRGGVK
jgi:hypothetical protein